MLGAAERNFMLAHPVAHLATADAEGVPHVVPVCFGLGDDTAYVTIDGKPKRLDWPLKRLTNIAVNPAVSLVVDRYDDDWTRLGWVMLSGRADILGSGAEHAAAQDLLRSRYPQLSGMDIAALPVIALRVTKVRRWGNLSI